MHTSPINEQIRLQEVNTVLLMVESSGFSLQLVKKTEHQICTRDAQ